MTTPRREQAEAMFAELRSVLRKIRETEAPADLDQIGLDSTDLPALLDFLRSLSECCTARAILYAQAAELLDRQAALWSSEKQRELGLAAGDS